VDRNGPVLRFRRRGLARFDGETWTTYSAENSDLPCDHVIGLAVDGEGNVWAGTETGGLAKFDGDVWTHFLEMDGPAGLEQATISEVSFDRQGRLWAGTASGAAMFDGESWTSYDGSNSALPVAASHEVVVDHAGNTWIGTEEGLAKFDGETWTLFTKTNSGLPSSWIRAIVCDEKGNIWVGMDIGGLAVYRKGGVDLAGGQ
jgi:ligand-binding sensor domain-containing protein